MKKWRCVTGAIKDKLSLIAATDDEFTVAIIKATSHDDLSMDIENVQFIYRYIQSNPPSFKPIIRAISLRVERTRSWTVALKCLMLLHGLFLTGITAVESIGRLPFDLSEFGKRKSRFSKTGRFNIFVRAYFSFLDERSVIFFFNDRNRLELIVKMQRIVDSLMRIKPIGETMKTPLVIEAMECVISEILEIYGQIRRGFAGFSSDVQSNPEKSSEAELAMKIVTKSLSQRDELFKYFELCRDFGVTNVQEISKYDVIVLDKLIHYSPELHQTAKVSPVTAEDMAEADLTNAILETASRRRDDDDIISPSDFISF